MAINIMTDLEERLVNTRRAKESDPNKLEF